MNILYFDCFSGISGDMTLAALIDLGVPLRHIKRELAKLPVSGYTVRVTSVVTGGISGKKVIVAAKHPDHHHRTFRDIDQAIKQSSLDAAVKEHSREVFLNLAKAEAAVHATPVETVHFHEVGAVDSIVDIVGSAIGFHYLGIEEFYASALPLGHGFVNCQHGRLPLPAPATVRLLKGIPVYDAGIDEELVTPTGAALIRHYVKRFEGMPAMALQSCGYGAGHREFADRPNMLRLILGNIREMETTEQVWSLETNLDDMNPEYTGYVIERLLAAGALDVTLTPVYMKKNRPGMLLTVLCSDVVRPQLMQLLFQETTTAGIRACRMQRTVLPRRQSVIATRFGRLKVKILTGPDGDQIMPEFEACRAAALRHKVALKDVYAEVIALGSTLKHKK